MAGGVAMSAKRSASGTAPSALGAAQDAELEGSTWVMKPSELPLTAHIMSTKMQGHCKQGRVANALCGHVYLNTLDIIWPPEIPAPRGTRICEACRASFRVMQNMQKARKEE